MVSVVPAPIGSTQSEGERARQGEERLYGLSGQQELRQADEKGASLAVEELSINCVAGSGGEEAAVTG